MNDALKAAAYFPLLRAPWSNEWMIKLGEELQQFLTGSRTKQQVIESLRKAAFDLKKKYE